jgi:hypothetical protein
MNLMRSVLQSVSARGGDSGGAAAPRVSIVEKGRRPGLKLSMRRRPSVLGIVKPDTLPASIPTRKSQSRRGPSGLIRQPISIPRARRFERGAARPQKRRCWARPPETPAVRGPQRSGSPLLGGSLPRSGGGSWGASLHVRQQRWFHKAAVGRPGGSIHKQRSLLQRELGMDKFQAASKVLVGGARPGRR